MIHPSRRFEVNIRQEFRAEFGMALHRLDGGEALSASDFMGAIHAVGARQGSCLRGRTGAVRREPAEEDVKKTGFHE